MTETFTYSSADLQTPKVTTALNFDQQLLDKWSRFMMEGNFRYNVDGLKSRRLKGRYRFIVQSQTNRSLLRRKPQAMMSVSQPVDSTAFNFTKVNAEKEVLFQLVNSTDSTRSGEDRIMINVSPIVKGSCLLTPQVDLLLPQLLTEHSITLALETIFLSSSPSFRLYFNSLCAYASVNHLHWHILYLEEQLYIQDVELVKAGTIHLLDPAHYPAPAFVFTITSATEIPQITKKIHKLTSWFVQNNIAHNVHITRGRNAAGENGSSVIRVFIWARQNVLGAKSSDRFVTAVCELTGQILLYQESHFLNIEEEEIIEALSTSVQPVYNKVVSEVKEMFSSED